MRNLPELVLVRLLAPRKGGFTANALGDEIGQLVLGHKDPELKQAVAREVEALLEQGSLAPAGGKRSKAVALTESGQREALRFLGLETRPPRLDWRTLKTKYLVARALQLPAPTDAQTRQKLDPDGVRALVLEREHDLPLPERPSLAQAKAALAWARLGLARSDPFSLSSVLKVVLEERLGAAPKQVDRGVRELAGLAVGGDASSEGLYRGLMQELVGAGAGAGAGAGPVAGGGAPGAGRQAPVTVDDRTGREANSADDDSQGKGGASGDGRLDRAPAAAGPGPAQAADVEPGSKPRPLEARELQEAILRAFTELRREKFTLGLVPLHAIRRRIERELGEQAASHAEFDPAAKALWHADRLDLIPLTHLGDASRAELEASIPNLGDEILFYAEAVE